MNINTHKCSYTPLPSVLIMSSQKNAVTVKDTLAYSSSASLKLRDIIKNVKQNKNTVGF